MKDMIGDGIVCDYRIQNIYGYYRLPYSTNIHLEHFLIQIQL